MVDRRGLDRFRRPGWFADPAQVPGGAFIDEGIYWVDVFRWLTGSEIVQVEAKMANLVHKDIAVEDWGLATFTFANGVIATLEAAWTINAPRATGPSPKQNSVVRTEIVGTRGEIIDQWFRSPAGRSSRQERPTGCSSGSRTGFSRRACRFRSHTSSTRSRPIGRRHPRSAMRGPRSWPRHGGL